MASRTSDASCSRSFAPARRLVFGERELRRLVIVVAPLVRVLCVVCVWVIAIHAWWWVVGTERESWGAVCVCVCGWVIRLLCASEIFLQGNPEGAHAPSVSCSFLACAPNWLRRGRGREEEGCA